MRTELRELAWDVLTDQTARSRGIFRIEGVTELLRQHAAGHDHSPRIWALLQFELWHRTFIDGPSTDGRLPGVCGEERQPS